jgi:hypothetical protein
LEGFTVKDEIGVGDKLQFTSLPENYYRATGERLVDVSKSWVFDHNPFVERDVPVGKIKRIRELWNYPRQWPWPKPRPFVYLSNAEIFASAFEVEATLIRPRLYAFESFPYVERSKILLHTQGRSHGEMPKPIVKHIIDKYGPTGRLYHIGPPGCNGYGLPEIRTQTLWQLAEVISQAAMFIGIDSGPSWIAACYPDIVVKKVRTKPAEKALRGWTPLEIQNYHSHWDDRIFQIYNMYEVDIGFTQSYRKI